MSDKPKVERTRIPIVEWFDPYNSEHIRAYAIFTQTGMWPENFLPDWVDSKSLAWNMALYAKMADAWVRHMFSTGNIKSTVLPFTKPE